MLNCVPYHYSQEVAAEEEASPPSWPSNAKLGRFTNFVNLLDMCGLALPSGLVTLDAVAAAEEVSVCERVRACESVCERV